MKEPIGEATCQTLVKKIFKEKIARAVFCLILFSFLFLGLLAEYWFVWLIEGLVAIFFFAYLIYIRAQSKRISKMELYLEQDTVTYVEQSEHKYKKFPYIEYMFHFRTYGIYKIKENLKRPFTIYIDFNSGVSYYDSDALQHCNCDEPFYLLIWNDKKQKRIIQCFSVEKFAIKEDEFLLSNDRYYIK